ncbi:hypothetical protein HY358_00105 [Candidatus Roizmanbacteria bacterium]|nr:hypothetical protein [Candidatus Roizmanbacteria bacterium]
MPFILHASNWFGLTIENSNLLYVYRHFDGPLYVIAAKSFYDPASIERLGLEFPLPPLYFAIHFPLYPLLIRFFSFLGYLQSMLAVSVGMSVLLGLLFFFLIKYFKLSSHPVLLTAIFLFLPRFLVVRSVGGSETLFMVFLLLSLLFFEKRQYLLAGLIGALAAATRSPGILLFGVYGLVFLEKFIKERKIEWRGWGIAFIPVGLLLVFYLFFLKFNDLLAYFHAVNTVHLSSLYGAFNYQKLWVGTAWLEDVLFYFFLYLFTVIALKSSKYRSFFYFSFVFTVALLFVQHRDIARYGLPIWPLACIAFEKFFTSKKFLIVFILLLPAIYLYGWNFLLYNIMPISNWSPFL